ncbi:haloacid dehalogenase type II [Trinickia violacea]|uniref:(S)-2-haloacid dehalogenase n=1 Tax=Trinickia violacea TaxID=2571746 RepID=A0A4P8IUS5_9BURK|nr:haloacid dehalogenase type II [Trinickia violacea]QCP52156.1 haloacid dehalogenase type II [Trinickia violacea]
MKHIEGIVFDLYGTLYDVHSVAGRCSEYFPGRGLEISLIWRQKQLEYTWLRSLMGHYLSFEEATEHALLYTCKHLKLPLNDEARRTLCDAYLKIQPFPEVHAALAELQSMGLPLAILSNGSVNSIRNVVGHSGLTSRFAHLISVETVEVFKPHPNVYHLAEKAFDLHRSQILFVSSNAWDASGARHFGFPVCWINRTGNTFDELGQTPDHVINSLDQLPRLLKQTHTA